MSLRRIMAGACLLLAGCSPKLVVTNHAGQNASDEASLVGKLDVGCTNSNDNDGQAGPRSLPNAIDVIRRVDAENPGLLQRSCVDQGGDNEFLFKVVAELRRSDVRWGLNWKRARVGDMSQDVVTYYRGRGPFEGGRDQYVIDIIGGHCGPNPTPAFNDVTCYNSAQCDPNGSIWTLEPIPKCGSNPGPGPGPGPGPQPVGCNASGSIVNNGYSSKNECEHTWSFTLTCSQLEGGCWKPGNAPPGPTPSPPAPPPPPPPPPGPSCNASGSFVNDGYASKNECEHTWGFSLTCSQIPNGCWKPSGQGAGCNANGSAVNAGYPSKNECEHTWGFTLTCDPTEHGCWKPQGR